jgi:hypothetical protein
MNMTTVSWNNLENDQGKISAKQSPTHSATDRSFNQRSKLSNQFA